MKSLHSCKFNGLKLIAELVERVCFGEYQVKILHRELRNADLFSELCYDGILRSGVVLSHLPNAAAQPRRDNACRRPAGAQWPRRARWAPPLHLGVGCSCSLAAWHDAKLAI